MDDSDDEDARPVYRSLANLPTPLISRQSSASSSVLLDADAKLTLHDAVDAAASRGAFGAGLHALHRAGGPLAEEQVDPGEADAHGAVGLAAAESVAGATRGRGAAADRGAEGGGRGSARASATHPSLPPTVHAGDRSASLPSAVSPPSLQPTPLDCSSGGGGGVRQDGGGGGERGLGFCSSDVGAFVAAHAVAEHSGRDWQGRSGGAAEAQAEAEETMMSAEEEIDELAHQWARLKLENDGLRETVSAATRDIDQLSSLATAAGLGAVVGPSSDAADAAPLAAATAAARASPPPPAASPPPFGGVGATVIVVEGEEGEEYEEGEEGEEEEEEEEAAVEAAMAAALREEAESPTLYRSLSSHVAYDEIDSCDDEVQECDDEVQEGCVLYRSLSAFHAAELVEQPEGEEEEAKPSTRLHSGSGGAATRHYDDDAPVYRALAATSADAGNSDDTDHAAGRRPTRRARPPSGPAAQQQAGASQQGVAEQFAPGKRSRSYASQLASEPLHPSKQASLPGSRASPTAEQVSAPLRMRTHAAPLTESAPRLARARLA